MTIIILAPEIFVEINGGLEKKLSFIKSQQILYCGHQ